VHGTDEQNETFAGLHFYDRPANVGSDTFAISVEGQGVDDLDRYDMVFDFDVYLAAAIDGTGVYVQQAKFTWQFDGSHVSSGPSNWTRTGINSGTPWVNVGPDHNNPQLVPVVGGVTANEAQDTSTWSTQPQ
jgi:hypothetical protein